MKLFFLYIINDKTLNNADRMIQTISQDQNKCCE